MIWVVGSLNMDRVARVTAIPHSGETVIADRVTLHSGGKGGNQAVAAARSGSVVTMIGAVAADTDGRELLASLVTAGVNTHAIQVLDGETGSAMVWVDAEGENRIVVNAGVNGKLFPDLVKGFASQIADDDWLLVQNELPEQTVDTILGWGRFAHCCWNASPVRAHSRAVLDGLELLVVNEGEAQTLSGRDDVEDAVEALLKGGVDRVVVTRGAKGAIGANRQGESWIQPAWPVQVVDTTGAGDTFVGALVGRLEEHRSMEEALRFASAAAALAVERSGAQESIPNRSEIEHLLTQMSPPGESGQRSTIQEGPRYGKP